MEYSITNLTSKNSGENIYANSFANDSQMEQREEFPLVSVLLASYNHEQYIEQSIRSIMEQKGVDFELIVIDDGSSDNSKEIIKKLQLELHFKYFHRENKGFVYTMNELLSLARGKYYCSFASDDIMPPDRLYKQSNFLKQHPKSIACFGQIKTLKNDEISKNVVELYLRNVPQVSFEEIFLSDKAIHGCSEMFVTEAVRKIGGYNETFYFEDMPLFFAILSEYGPQVASADFVCCYYRIHESNMHSSHDKMYNEIFRLLKLYKNHPLYNKALNRWKTRYFSTLAYKNKLKAFRMIPKLMSFTPSFFLRLVKILIPKFLLKC